MKYIQSYLDIGLSNIYAQMERVNASTERGESGCPERAALSVLECNQAKLNEKRSQGSSFIELASPMDDLNELLSEMGFEELEDEAVVRSGARSSSPA
jgi:hypothetical protein